MGYGLIVSLVLHLALLGWTLLSIQSTPPLVESKPEPVEISIISPDDIVRLKQGDRESKIMEAAGKDGPAKEPPKKEPVKPTPPPLPTAAAPPPAPEPPKPEPPKPEPPKSDPIAEKLASAVEPTPPPKAAPAPTVDDQKLLDEKLAEEADLAAKTAAVKAKAEADAKAAQAEAERKKKLAEEQRKKELERKRLADAKAKADAKKAADAKAAQSLDSIVNAALKNAPDQAVPPKALLDKTPPKAAPVTGAKTASALKGPAAGAPEGTDTRLTADKLSMLAILMRDNVKRCWNINAGMEGANRLVIKAQIKLAQDGRLLGEPLIVNTTAGPQFEDAANSAKRAIIECQPYINLPPELYAGGWDFMVLIFDPSRMF